MRPPLPPPDERRCRAMVAVLLDRGVYWRRPQGCWNYAGPTGYCRYHQPPEPPVELRADDDTHH